MDTTETTAPAVSSGSSLNPSSTFGYIRSFLAGRTGNDFLQECYSLQEAYEEGYTMHSKDGFSVTANPERETRLLSKLIALAKGQGVQFGMASRVIANGYPGVVTKTHEYDELLAGMVTVRLESGEIIVPRSELVAP